MLGNKIEHLLVPALNFYESNEPSYFPDTYQIIEKASYFEDIFKKMKLNTKAKISLRKCSNPNCIYPFSGPSNCKECISCGAKFCFNCIKQCQLCSGNICLFCTTIKYDKYEDVELCPICAESNKE